MRLIWTENDRGFANVTLGVPLETRFSNLFVPDVHNGKTKWRLVVAGDENLPELQELAKRLQAHLERRYELYMNALPPNMRHRARKLKNVRDSKLFQRELDTSDATREPVPTGYVRMSAHCPTETLKGVPRKPLILNREGKPLELEGELPWGSKVLLKLGVGVYGAEAQMRRDAPSMEYAGVTLYLDAIRVLAFGEGGLGRSGVTQDWADEDVAAALKETESMASNPAPKDLNSAPDPGAAVAQSNRLPRKSDDEASDDWMNETPF